MKKINIVFMVCTAMMLILTSGCGTIANGITKTEKDHRPVFLMNCPSDAVLTFKGKTYAISTADYIKYKVVTHSTTNMPAVYLPYKESGDLTISSAAMGKTNTIKMKAGLWGPTTCGNCIIAPIVGHGIDYFTKNDRVLKPRVIDVTAFLKGEPKNMWQKP